MKSVRVFRAALAACLIGSTLLGGGAPAAAGPAAKPKAAPRGEQTVQLKPFRSDAELRAFLARRKRAADRWMAENPPPPPPPPAPAPPPPSGPSVGAAASSITNNQEANVDEGDIVKNRGDLLIILRRGRLFTVSTAGGQLKAVDRINAYPPGVDGGGDWYDEMLVSGDRVIVIGYSYTRGGTQVNRFRVSPEGKLSFEDAYQVKSSDYYSSRNYASRMIGNTLIVYSPMSLSYDKDPYEALPSMRKWAGQKGREGFRRIVGARQIYLADGGRGRLAQDFEAIHAVTRCDVAAPVMDCTSTGVIGDWSRTFYMSSTGVYVWTSTWLDDERGLKATLYRLPLDGGRPSAVSAHGQPVDQFSFREAPDHRSVDVVVRSQSAGDGMWRSEFSMGTVALLRLPVDARGLLRAGDADYRMLPKPVGSNWSFQNRFVGDYLLYGLGQGYQEKGGSVTVVPLAGGQPVQVALSHGVDRIDLMGLDAILVGGNESALHFSSLELTGGAPRLGDHYSLEATGQGETRSHGFFYRPDPDGAANGVFGLPVDRWVDFPDGSGRTQGAVLFVRRDERRFRPLGELAGQPLKSEADGCVASCVDWYGNARPIFLGDRVYALMGYELVEGVIERGGIREVRRVDFMPRS